MKRICLGLMLCFGLACNEENHSHSRGKTKPADIQRDAAKAIDTTGRYVSEQKDDFARRMQSRLDTADAQIRELRHSIDKEGKSAQAGADDKLRALEQKRAAAAQQLDQLKRSSEASWRDFRNGVERAVDDLSPSDRK